MNPDHGQMARSQFTSEQGYLLLKPKALYIVRNNFSSRRSAGTSSSGVTPYSLLVYLSLGLIISVVPQLLKNGLPPYI